MNGALGPAPSVGEGHVLAAVLTVAAVLVVATAAAFAVRAHAADAWTLTQLTNNHHGAGGTASGVVPG